MTSLSPSLQVPESCTNSPLPNPDGYYSTLHSKTRLSSSLVGGHIHHGHGWNKDKYGTSRIREKPMEHRQIHVEAPFDKPPTPSQAPPGSSGIGPLSSL
ncbi:hypothetical protein FOBRF1_011550 [Fusarium oxysporum]